MESRRKKKDKNKINQGDNVSQSTATSNQQGQHGAGGGSTGNEIDTIKKLV